VSVARTILAAFIAIAVAMGPAASGGTSISVTSAGMSMADQADMPCCPPSDDCKGSVACAFKCLNFVAVTFPAAIALATIIDTMPAASISVTLHGYVSPPTHPPPI
jgi:hypothetical protein